MDLDFLCSMVSNETILLSDDNHPVKHSAIKGTDHSYNIALGKRMILSTVLALARARELFIGRG